MRRIAYFSTAVFYSLALPHFAGTESAEAAVIYSQMSPAQPVGAFTSTDRPDYPKAADNFLLNVTQSTTVRSIRFVGGYTATMPPPITPPLDSLPIDSFRVVFMGDTGQTPGAPLAGGDFATGAAARRAPTHGSILNGVQFPIEYVLDLGSGITLTPNAVFWLSILNDPGSKYGWQWARTLGVYDQFTAETEGNVSAGAWSVYSTGGMFFSLDNANVPEPDTSTIFIFALMGIPVLHHRRRGIWM